MEEIDKRQLSPIMQQKIGEIGQRIKRIRTEKKVTQQTLAFCVGADKGLVSEIERGYCKNITLLTIMRIAMALEVELNQLFID